MRRCFFLVLTAIVLQHHAHASCSRLPRLVCAEYANSDVVVIAKLVEVKHYAPPDKQDWHIYTMRADKLLRGKIDVEFRIYEENSSGRAPFDWIKGESYVLFLTNRGDGAWWLFGCGNSTPFKRAARVLEAIESIKTRSGGLIQGIIGQEGEGASLKGAHVSIKSDDATYSATVDGEGKFSIHVPSGHYVVRVSLPEWSFKKDDINTYEDPLNVVIEDGGCAEIAFTAVRKH
jgi:hypothetical protein